MKLEGDKFRKLKKNHHTKPPKPKGKCFFMHQEADLWNSLSKYILVTRSWYKLKAKLDVQLRIKK